MMNRIVGPSRRTFLSNAAGVIAGMAALPLCGEERTPAVPNIADRLRQLIDHAPMEMRLKDMTADECRAYQGLCLAPRYGLSGDPRAESGNSRNQFGVFRQRQDGTGNGAASGRTRSSRLRARQPAEPRHGPGRRTTPSFPPNSSAATSSNTHRAAR